jgi:ferritin
MKAVKRKHTSLTEEVENKLNKQIKMEGLSSQFYLSCASWCHKEGFEQSAKFLYQHSEEERVHMLKIFHYVNNAGGHAIAPELTDIRNQFGSLREIFESVLEHEIAVTKSISKLVDACFEAKDFLTFQFMQWFISEQREEEELARRVIELFDLIGEEGQGLWLIDQEIGKLGAAAAAKNTGGADAEGANA